MDSEAGIANLALAHIGVEKSIAALTERSKEAEACKLFYAQARNELLAAVPWPFATKIADLTLVEEDPNTEWSYSYRYPSDCVNFRRILSGNRVDTPSTAISYKIGADTEAKLIFTDREDAECEYTVLVTNVVFFPDDFVQALALRLAAMIAPRLTAGDPFKMGARAQTLYEKAVADAITGAFAEEQLDKPGFGEFVDSR